MTLKGRPMSANVPPKTEPTTKERSAPFHPKMVPKPASNFTSPKPKTSRPASQDPTLEIAKGTPPPIAKPSIEPSRLAKASVPNKKFAEEMMSPKMMSGRVAVSGIVYQSKSVRDVTIITKLTKNSPNKGRSRTPTA